jgi:hypothetical protein
MMKRKFPSQLAQSGWVPLHFQMERRRRRRRHGDWFILSILIGPTRTDPDIFPLDDEDDPNRRGAAAAAVELFLPRLLF